MGELARVFASNSVAIGNRVEASESGTFVYGYNAKAVGQGSLAMGYGAVAGAQINAEKYLAISTELAKLHIDEQNNPKSLVNDKGEVSSVELENFKNIVNTQIAKVSEAQADGSLYNYEKEGGIDKIYLELGSNGNKTYVKKTLSEGENTVAIGRYAFAIPDNSMALGYASLSESESALTLGSYSRATKNAANSIAIGVNAYSDGLNSLVFGYSASSFSNDSMAIGMGAMVKRRSSNAVAFGKSARASADGAMAFGNYAEANLANSVALGYQSKTDYTTEDPVPQNERPVNFSDLSQEEQNKYLSDFNKYAWMPNGRDAIYYISNEKAGIISVGQKLGERRITNLAPGALGTDAVNVDQLRSVYYQILADLAASNSSNQHHYLSVSSSGQNSQLETGMKIQEKYNDYLNKKAQYLSYLAREKLNNENFNDSAIQEIQEDIARIERNNPTFVQKATALAAYSSNDTNFGNATSITEALNNISLAKDNDAKQRLNTVITEEQIMASNYNNNTAIAADSIAIGYAASAVGSDTEGAIGGVAIGATAKVTQRGGIALGNQAEATGQNAISIGSNDAASKNMAQGKYSVAIGTKNNVTGEKSVAVGYGHMITGSRSGAFGDPNTVSGSDSYAIGNENTVSGSNAFAIGNSLIISGSYSGAFGNKSDNGTKTTVSGQHSYSIGNGNNLTKGWSFAIGNYIDTKDDPTGTHIYLGDRAKYVSSSDMSKGISSYTSFNSNNITYSNFAEGAAVGGVLTIASWDPNVSKYKTRRLQGVAPGLIAEGSTDAINGSQLYSVITTGTGIRGNYWNQTSGGQIPAVMAPGTFQTMGNAYDVIAGTWNTNIDSTSIDNIRYKSDNLATYVNIQNMKQLLIGMRNDPTFKEMILRDTDRDGTSAAAKGVKLTSTEDTITLTRVNGPTTGTHATETTGTVKLTNLTDATLSSSSTDAVTGKQLYSLAEKAGLTGPINGIDGTSGKDGATIAGADGVSGKNGIEGAAGVPGSNGTTGLTGPAGRDGLNDTTLGNKVQSLRDGIAGTVVYTYSNPTNAADPLNGERVLVENGQYYKPTLVKGKQKANDGLWYPEDKVKADGSLAADAPAGQKLSDLATANDIVNKNSVVLSTVNPDGKTTTPVTLGNVASVLGIEPTALKQTDKPLLLGGEAIGKEAAQKAVGKPANESEAATGLFALKGAALNRVVTAADLQALAVTGLNFKGDIPVSSSVNVPLGETLKIYGGQNDASKLTETTSGNIGVVVDTTGLVIRLAKTLSNLSEVKTDKLTLGSTGTVPSLIADQGNIKLSDNTRITNLAKGIGDNDAVNLAQVKELLKGGAASADVDAKADKTIGIQLLGTKTAEGTTNKQTLASDIQFTIAGDGKYLTTETTAAGVSVVLSDTYKKILDNLPEDSQLVYKSTNKKLVNGNWVDDVSSASQKVKLGDGLNFIGDKNITTAVEAGGKVSVALKNTLTGVNSIESEAKEFKVGETSTFVTSKIELKGDRITLNSQILDGLTAGEIKSGSTQAITGSQIYTLLGHLGLEAEGVNSIKEPSFTAVSGATDATARTTFKAAIDDVIEVVNKGISFSGNQNPENKTSISLALGKVLEVKASDVSNTTDPSVIYKGDNLITQTIAATAGQNGQIIIGLKQDPDFNSITVGAATATDHSGGITFTKSAANKLKLSSGTAGTNKITITNLAAGSDDSDAAT